MANAAAVPKIVSKAEWLAARKKLLAREKEVTHVKDALAAERRALPWVRVEQNYEFDTPKGKKSLAELFDGRSQLAVYHLMFGPEWKEACPSCSMIADGFDGMLPHLNQRDVALTAISRASLDQIEAFKKRMGWRFPWASSKGNSFNHDYQVTFTKEELASGTIYNFGTMKFGSEEAPGFSVFAKDSEGNVFHTYSSYGRGLDEMLGAYVLLDRTPKGRDEGGLSFPMAWVRHHDRYEVRPGGDAGCCSAGH